MWRKLVSALLPVVAAAILCLPGAAHAGQGLAALPEDIDESWLRAEIAQFINESYRTVYEDGEPKAVLAADLSADDIDLSLAVRIYDGTDLFSGDAPDLAAAEGQLEEAGYMLVIQMYFGGDTYQAQVVKGRQPDYSGLSEEVLAELSAHPEWTEDLEGKVGKWYLQTVGYSEGVKPGYGELAAEVSGVPDGEPLLVNGLPHLHYPVAIYPDGEGGLGAVAFLHPGTVPWRSLGLERPDEGAGAVFDYGYVKETVNSLPPEETPEEPAATTDGDQTNQEPATTGAESPSSSPPGAPSSPSGTDAAIGPASADTPGTSAPPPSGGTEQDPALPPQDAPGQPSALLPITIAVAAAAAAVVAALALRARRRKAKAPSSAQGDGQPSE
ncbi:MAG: hypothetical protein LBL86_09615 [Coriobacteriales bacterium]|jgi:hypothetical protein|nr:hypothetical protein [Coriobacteriales bacterium]